MENLTKIKIPPPEFELVEPEDAWRLIISATFVKEKLGEPNKIYRPALKYLIRESRI